MPKPIVRVSDIAFPRFQAPDLERMEAFLQAFGMHRFVRTEDALYMRGTDPQPVAYAAHRGDSAFLGLAFRAASRADLATLAAATGVPLSASDEPGGGEVVRLTDPDGRRVDVFFGQEELAPLPLRAHPPLNTGAARVRAGELQRIAAGPAQVKRCGHAALKTTNLSVLSAWYGETLGMLTSDDIYVGGPEQPVGRFLRCDRGADPADHHTLLLIETPEVKLGHVAFEVADFDDLMVGHEHLSAQSHGARAYWGIGRHLLGGQIFDYWKDPFGFTIEHWTDSDLLRADAPAGAHDVFSALSQWGPPPPPDLDF